MAKITYDHWHELLGQDLYVTIGSRLFIGEFLGLKPLSQKQANGRRVEYAWAMSTLDGIVYFDPDNAAVVVHTSAYRARKIAAIPLVEQGSAHMQQWITEAEQVIRRAQDVSSAASQWVERSEVRQTGSERSPLHPGLQDSCNG